MTATVLLVGSAVLAIVCGGTSIEPPVDSDCNVVLSVSAALEWAALLALLTCAMAACVDALMTMTKNLGNEGDAMPGGGPKLRRRAHSSSPHLRAPSPPTPRVVQPPPSSTLLHDVQ